MHSFFLSITQIETPVLCTKAAMHCRSSRLPKSFLAIQSFSVYIHSEHGLSLVFKRVCGFCHTLNLIWFIQSSVVALTRCESHRNVGEWDRDIDSVCDTGWTMLHSDRHVYSRRQTHMT